MEGPLGRRWAHGAPLPGLRGGRNIALRSAGRWDHVTALGCWSPDFEREHIQQLLSASGRVPLYVCAECGDIGCGAITALVERTPDGFVWRDFAFGNNYDETMTDTDSYRHIGSFLFNKTEYWHVLKERAAALSGS